MTWVTVWRYENSEGEGPYNCEDYWDGKDHMGEAHGDSSHESWEADGLHWCVDSDYVAGCPSHASLLVWFDGFHRDLLRAGFHVMTYHVPEENVELSYSGNQLAFVKDSVRGVNACEI